MELMTQWNGHSCFTLGYDGYTLVLDPYEDHYVPGLSPLRVEAHEVLCSHGHSDHGAANLVKLRAPQKSPFRITRIPSFHDPEQGRLRGGNTIHLLECPEYRIAHFGDLGCPLSDNQLTALGRLDVAMVPIGGCYTIDPQQAKELIDRLQPKIVLPMHFRSDRFGFDVLATLEDFLSLVSGVVAYPGNHRYVTTDSPGELSILTYPG